MKRLLLILIFLICFVPGAVFSLEPVTVAILQFQTYSQEDISHLKPEISNLLAKHLKQEGATVVLPDPGTDFSKTGVRFDIAEIRKTGIRSSADYVIWGSITLVGQKFSLDVKMTDVFGNRQPFSFFIERNRLESLSEAVKNLSVDIGLKLFNRERVAKVIVTGNKRIEADAIKRIVKTQPGDVYRSQSVYGDMKAIFAMGYFDDIRIEAESGPTGKIVIFNVKEKPTIRYIRIKGNSTKGYKNEEIKENLTIRTGSILNLFRIQKNIKIIEDLYKEKNFHNIKVAYDIHQLENNQCDLKFTITEGKRVLIKKIIFEGNNDYKDKNLKKVMKSSEKGIFSWITSSGELDREELKHDSVKIKNFYHNNGYIRARVGEPQIDFKEDGIYIRIKIVEGARFKVGKVDIEGDFVLTKEELLKKLKITGKEYYSREILRNDILSLTDMYSDEGYAYTDISPRINEDTEKSAVNIVYAIKKNKQVYFDQIIISGNTRTRNKVIRRELKVYEQELYSGRRLKQGVRNLYRLDFFEDIKINTLKGDSDENMTLKIDVKEKSTGMFSFGVGYSTIDKTYFNSSIQERNLFGRGQNLKFETQFGETTDKYDISFTEPWLFDIPLSAGINIYNWNTDYDTYGVESIGGGFKLSYPVFNFTRAYWAYAYDSADIRDIASSASDSIKAMESTNVTSSITTSMRYDSRDRAFNATEGSDHKASIQYAGIGGDIGFVKLKAETGRYFPLYKETVGFLHFKTGYVRKNSGMKLPDYERFYLGGMNSVRGFDRYDIGPKVVNSNGILTNIGGDKFIQFNAEYLIPLLKEQGIVGVLFFDTGDVFNNNENLTLSSLRESAGYGIRWYSPMGPIRIEYGHILDPKEGESTGRWEFTMGQAF